MTTATLKLRDYQVSRWRKLAEQRLEHLTDLFVSGRWRRYFEEADFLENVRQTKNAVATWRRLDAPQLATPMPPRLTLAFVADDEKDETLAATEPMPEQPIIGLLAPHIRLDKFLEEPELVSVAAVADVRPALRLPSPFEDTRGTTALERFRRL
jgi:uncharacterized repeat protein (TIGR03809 family)